MADSALSPEDAAAKRASEQARLRKERRQAKIKAGGSARLNKITGLGGREPIPDQESAATTATDTSPASQPTAPAPSDTSPSSNHHADPEEVDISEHYYEPKKAAARTPIPGPTMTEDDLRQMMLGFERGNTPRQPSPNPNGSPPNLDEDPMMKMMSQLMSGAGFPTDGSSPFPGMPAGANPFQPQPAQPAQSSASANIWRVLHALVALGLGLYVVLLTPFAGTKIERDRAALPITTSEDPFSTPIEVTDVETDLEQRKLMFFWAFATAETVLLTTRFFLLKQGPQPTGIAGTVVGFLPQPYRGYVEIVLRYGQIFTTVRGDMLACIFVLGACAWARG